MGERRGRSRIGEIVRGHVHSLYSFVKCLAEGTPPQPSLQEGLHLQRVLEAVRQAAAGGGWVRLPEAR